MLSKLLTLRQDNLFEVFKAGVHVFLRLFEALFKRVEMLIYRVKTFIYSLKASSKFAPQCFGLIAQAPDEYSPHSYRENNKLPDRLAASIRSRAIDLFDFSFSLCKTVSQLCYLLLQVT